MFDILRRYGMKLNPLKCSFGVGSGKFLGFIVNARGIEANPTQISALREMRPPRTKRELQSLNGKIAALNRFISKATDRCLPFFDALRKGKKDVQWTPECQKAFEELIQHMATPPMLSKPNDGEDLFLYLAVSAHALSAALVREDSKVQRPVYYISKRLTGAELNYPKVEKLAYCLLIASKKLRPYFQAHPIRVLTDQPLRQVLFRPETSGRLLKWNIELSQYDITYHPLSMDSRLQILSQSSLTEERSRRIDLWLRLKLIGSCLSMVRQMVTARGQGWFLKPPKGEAFVMR